MKEIYAEAMNIRSCSYIVMDFAPNQNLYHYISRQHLSQQATLILF